MGELTSVIDESVVAGEETESALRGFVPFSETNIAQKAIYPVDGEISEIAQQAILRVNDMCDKAEVKIKFPDEQLDEYYELNQEIMTKLGIGHGLTRLGLRKAADYLRSPIIIDNFLSHNDRRKWEIELLELASVNLSADEDIKIKDRLNYFFNNNRLGSNTMSNILTPLISLRSVKDKIPELASLVQEAFELQNLITNGVTNEDEITYKIPPYKDYSLEQKIAFSERVANLARRYLEFFALKK